MHYLAFSWWCMLGFLLPWVRNSKRKTVNAKFVYSIFIKFLHIVFIIIYCLPLVLKYHAHFFPIPQKKLPWINNYLVYMALSFFSLINSFVLNGKHITFQFLLTAQRMKEFITSETKQRDRFKLFPLWTDNFRANQDFQIKRVKIDLHRDSLYLK